MESTPLTSRAELRRAASGGGQAGAPKLGAFLGVFTPTILTILGVIMFLRFGWVVGHVGLGGALLIELIANSITLVTALSFSAIATNTRVGVGGAYFIISRSLGLEIGGAIGLPLFLSQVTSVTLYAFGLAESFRSYLPALPLEGTAFVIILLVGALSLKGANVALRTQIPVMVAVGLAVLALFAGVLLNEPVAAPPDLPPPEEPSPTFWMVFAVFFPAVTGITAGLGLSGDLRDPRRDIPRGAITATLVGLVLYIGILVALSHGADPAALISDPMIWTKMALGGPVLIVVGMWGAIFSSAVGSILNAPRTLQALVSDHTSPHGLLGRLARRQLGEEPIVCLAASLALALGAVFLGDLNAVAEVVTMFFLTVYGAINLVAALETLSGDATWRPRLHAPWLLSLAAGLGCFAVMFLINWVASLAALSLELALWLFFQRLERRADWGDMRRDIYEALIRWALVRLSQRPLTARNWRPHILVFADDIHRRLDLVRFGSWFSQERGVVTVCELHLGDVLEAPIDREERRAEIHRVLDQAGILAFGEVDLVSNLERGMVDVVQAHGLAGLESNTILMGWPQPENLPRFLSVLKRMEHLRKSIIIGKAEVSTFARETSRGTIHIWWGGLERNGDLMLLLAHLLTRNPQWRGADIEVCSIASNELTKSETQQLLDTLLPESRIDARTRVIVKPKDLSIREVIHAESKGADIVFLGLATPEPGDEETYAKRMVEAASGLGTVFFVKNASPFGGRLIG